MRERNPLGHDFTQDDGYHRDDHDRDGKCDGCLPLGERWQHRTNGRLDRRRQGRFAVNTHQQGRGGDARLAGGQQPAWVFLDRQYLDGPYIACLGQLGQAAAAGGSKRHFRK
jgi:hypothetical protein